MAKRSARHTSLVGLNFRNQCADCAYRDIENPSICKAFPVGIPLPIMADTVSHKNKYPGDKGIRFRKKS